MTDLALSETGIVEAIGYSWASAALRHEFASLQCRVYPLGGGDEDAATVPLHDPAFDAFSFYIREDSQVVSYAAIAKKTIEYAGDTFNIAGLSCVMTDPGRQRQGLGLRVVSAATRCLERSSLDIGVFTCDPPLVRFYAQAGCWPIAPNVVLIGSRHPGALRSDALGKVVLMRLFSLKALAAASTLTNATIDLNLPVGQFL
ncbi:GNAT family N-acetyltransferase [Mesorhizobium retamae]|uniref:GNAT family N-acetyltransferase n=1 Tax=Mesorhizobium retamae TaxID=2912854 RepID=A0ABS9QMI2_9HYPH|nr:GNAT family N-acetyltransferase [Mesorhizobium sp. IRAMC:0171]MCG7508632.1 GNAT family N-acetyltransferase [Mesorhizobium sp. IRAMC:0171]